WPAVALPYRARKSSSFLLSILELWLRRVPAKDCRRTSAESTSAHVYALLSTIIRHFRQIAHKNKLLGIDRDNPPSDGSWGEPHARYCTRIHSRLRWARCGGKHFSRWCGRVPARAAAMAAPHSGSCPPPDAAAHGEAAAARAQAGHAARRDHSGHRRPLGPDRLRRHRLSQGSER